MLSGKLKKKNYCHFTFINLKKKLLYRDMVKKYRHSEFMWQKLAKIHFDGFIYHHETEQLHYDKNYISGIRFVTGLIFL